MSFMDSRFGRFNYPVSCASGYCSRTMMASINNAQPKTSTTPAGMLTKAEVGAVYTRMRASITSAFPGVHNLFYTLGGYAASAMCTAWGITPGENFE